MVAELKWKVYLRERFEEQQSRASARCGYADGLRHSIANKGLPSHECANCNIAPSDLREKFFALVTQDDWYSEFQYESAQSILLRLVNLHALCD